MISRFQTKHYKIHNQVKAIDIKEAYELYISNNLVDSTINTNDFIRLSKLHGVKTRQDRNKNHNKFFVDPSK